MTTPTEQPLFPDLGFGLGLRREHYQHVVDQAGTLGGFLEPPTTTPLGEAQLRRREQRPAVGWFEVISENFMVPGGNPRRVLERVRRDYPVVLHGVSLSIGSTDPIDHAYLDGLDALARAVEPAWISDHLCWGTAHGFNAHDLLPLPYTAAALEHVAARVSAVQERLGRRILLENPSSYLAFRDSEMSEAEFLAELARRADCGILLDVNNVYVSAHNHGFDARDYLAAMPAERIGQIHLAGHSLDGELLIDTHDAAVCEEVWQLYGDAVRRFGPRATMIEWDAHVPPFDELAGELERARAVASGAAAGREGRDAA